MINIAIDGPSGAGKSTVAQEIAKRLKIVYLDTGAMYRAIAWIAIDKGIDPNDEKEVEKILPDAHIVIDYKDNKQIVYANSNDVTKAIREHYISKAASDISKIPSVRLKLVEMQRKIARSKDVVLDGRDITSFVLPEAKHKFYLTASAEERANRRYLELREKGIDIDYSKLLEDINLRDKNDMERDFAPLVKTDDSILIDSTNLTKDEVVDKILSHIK